MSTVWTCGSYPTNEKRMLKVPLFSPVREYVPSGPVTTPVSEPSTATLAPARGSPLWSVTFPLSIAPRSCWEYAAEVRVIVSKKINRRICLIICQFGKFKNCNEVLILR